MAIVTVECRVSAEQVGRVDLIVQQLAGRSRAEVRGMFDHGCIERNGSPCDEPGTRVEPEDLIVVRHDPHRRYREKPRQKSGNVGNVFRLVYEDDDLIVVDKAAGFLTVPTDRRETNTLVDALTRHVSRRRHRARVWVVHRLDRDTSGLLVFGKTSDIARQLQDQFRIRKTEREYSAIVAGEITDSNGTFSSRLATAKKSLQRYSVRRDDEGEHAVTHYRVEQRLAGATYVRVQLETGRRNQIRVHFAEAGHPVLGDKRYEPERATHPAWTTRRLALHATTLAFDHPQTRQPMRFESPLPPEFVRFLKRSRSS